MSKELLFRVTKKDFVVTWFRGSGGGGQHRNKHANCCRIRHPASGAVTTGQEGRSRPENQRMAFRRMVQHPKFKMWYNRRIAEAIDGRTIEEWVDEQMRPENIQVEVRTEHGWIPE